MMKSFLPALMAFSFFDVSVVAAQAAAQNIYTFESHEVTGFTIASDVKPACKSASEKAFDKGVRLCQDLGGPMPTVESRRLNVEGPYCTVTITFRCLTDLN